MTDSRQLRSIQRSPQQRLLFFLESARPRGSARAVYAVQSNFRLTGPISSDRLRLAWHAVMGEAQQTIACEMTLLGGTFTIELCPTARELTARVQAWEGAPMDPQHGPLMQMVYLRTSDRDARLLLRAHCAVCDGRGLRLMADRLAHHYEYVTADPSGEAEQQRFPVTENEGVIPDDARAYWTRVLAQCTLPSLGRGELIPSFGRSPQAAELRCRLSPRTSMKVKAIVREGHLSLSSIGLAAWATFLLRKSPENILIPTPTLMRRTTRLEHSFGAYLDLLLIPTPSLDVEDFETFANAMQNSTIDTLDHECALMPLIEKDHSLRRVLRDPNVALIPFQALSQSKNASFRIGSALCENLSNVVTCNAGYSLPFDGLMTILDSDQGMELVFEYRVDRFHDQIGSSLLANFSSSFESSLSSIT